MKQCIAKIKKDKKKKSKEGLPIFFSIKLGKNGVALSGYTIGTMRGRSSNHVTSMVATSRGCKVKNWIGLLWLYECGIMGATRFGGKDGCSVDKKKAKIRDDDTKRVWCHGG